MYSGEEESSDDTGLNATTSGKSGMFKLDMARSTVRISVSAVVTKTICFWVSSRVVNLEARLLFDLLYVEVL